jgi:Tfp pilus assembly protein PilF
VIRSRPGARAPRGVAAFALALGTLFRVGPALADTSPADRAAAQSLFEEGRALMQTGKLAEACAKLEKSEELDPGGGTMLNLALCHERQGRTATAWAEYHDALDMARKDKRSGREDFARQHIAELTPALSRLTVKVPAEGTPAAIEITRNGAPLKRAAWGTPAPVDPGPQTILARAPGYEDWSFTFTLGGRADSKTVEVPPLRRGASAAGPGLQRALGFTLVGLGAAALGVGVGFGIHALASEATAHSLCGGDTVCPTQAGLAQSQSAVTSAKVADGLIFGGLGVAGVGLAVALVARPAGAGDTAASAALVAGPGRVGLALRF